MSREKGDPDLVDNLEALYSYMVRRLLHANLHNDQEAITEVLGLLENCRCLAANRPKLSPVAGPI